MQVQEKAMKVKSQQSPKSELAALRAELEIELKNKKQCSYQPYECTQLTIDGYKYCLKHILQDKNSPFKQCSFVYTNNGKRCQLPAPRGDKKDYGYCNDHALKATLARNKQNSKFPPPHTAEVLLQSLSHYVRKLRKRTVSSSSAQHSDDGGRITPDDMAELKVTKSFEPFTDLDANAIYNEQCNDVLDLCSESESDVEPSTFSSVWHDAHGDSSDNESIDSDQEDVLKHANAYTAEEITLVTRDKLIRLQSLYIEQYRHLQHLLKERRRKYLHSLKREKETCCNIYNQIRDNPKEQRLYKKLKAYNNYHKAHGVDAILNKRLRDLRAKITNGVAPKGHNYSKCLFTEGGVKCGERTLPLARHCRKHILEDVNQVLFKPCSEVNGDVECTTPVEAIFDDSTCRLHTDIPLLRSYNQPRKDSESDFDDSADPHHFPLQMSENVKTEFMDYSLPPEIPKMETLPSMLFEESVQDSVFHSEKSNHSMDLINMSEEISKTHDDIDFRMDTNEQELKTELSSRIIDNSHQESTSETQLVSETQVLKTEHIIECNNEEAAQGHIREIAKENFGETKGCSENFKQELEVVSGHVKDEKIEHTAYSENKDNELLEINNVSDNLQKSDA